MTRIEAAQIPISTSIPDISDGADYAIPEPFAQTGLVISKDDLILYIESERERINNLYAPILTGKWVDPPRRVTDALALEAENFGSLVAGFWRLQGCISHNSGNEATDRTQDSK